MVFKLNCDWLLQGDGAWEPKERVGKKPTKGNSNPKTQLAADQQQCAWAAVL